MKIDDTSHFRGPLHTQAEAYKFPDSPTDLSWDHQLFSPYPERAYPDAAHTVRSQVFGAEAIDIS